MNDICFSCKHRAESIARVEEYLERNPLKTGLCCDPTPRAECKYHEGYGYKPAR
jgi:hypothetical protein